MRAKHTGVKALHHSADSRVVHVAEGIISNHRSAIVHHQEHFNYDFGPQHPLRPERIHAGLDLLEAAGVWEPASETLHSVQLERETLERIHDPLYIRAVEEAGNGWFPQSELRKYGLSSGDNPPFPGMHGAASFVAGGAVEAVRHIFRGSLDHAFHPAGGLHHAHRARASGFCIYNDPALAASIAVEEFGARVLYIDVDCHHGDGVQWIFYNEPRVMTVSFHESGRYLFPGTGDVDEIGEGAGEGYAFNVPMQPFTHDSSWQECLRELLPPLADRFGPDIILSAHGADTHVWDPLTHLSLTTESFSAQAQCIHELAHTHCNGRWLAFGSGGYDWRRVVPRSWAILWAEMTGRTLAEELPQLWLDRWKSRGEEPLPTRFRDDPGVSPPGSPDDRISRANRDALRRVRQLHDSRRSY